MGNENKAYIIKTESENEYFILENRQLLDWDEHLPHHGMLVWHIDFNETVWNNNTVNINSKHQYVDLVEADGIPSNWTRDGDVFPGLYEKEEFTSTSTPALVSWKGKSLGIDIKDIKETPDGQISFYAKTDRQTSRIETLFPSEAPDVRYFNLQGIEVKNPSRGELIIERNGHTARKIIY